MSRLFNGALKRFFKYLTANRCQLCGEVIELDEKLCPECAGLKKISSQRCELCGGAADDCSCKKKKREFSKIYAPYYYRGCITRAVYNFKMNDMPFLSHRFAREMYDCLKEADKDFDKGYDYITFVPLSKRRQLRRGYNQSELLAKDLALLINTREASMLKKLRDTGIQHHKTASQRAAAVFGSYDVVKDFKYSLEGKRILLVDDVKTTGSTLNECAKMLKIYGASEVCCVVFAVSKPKKQKKNKDLQKK